MQSYFPEDLALEEEDDESLINGALAALAGTSALAAGGTAAEVARRAKRSPDSLSMTDALKQLGRDIGSAGRVLRGSTLFDETERRIATNEMQPDDETFRSLRQFAEKTKNPENSQYAFTRQPENREQRQAARGTYISNPLTQTAIAARDAFNPSPEDFLSLNREFRQSQGRSAEGPRTDTVFSRIPSLDVVRDLAPEGSPISFSPDERRFRDVMNLSVPTANFSQQAGSLIGRTASDFVNNGARSLWWLLNAPQAVVDVASEGTAARMNREGLYGQEMVGFEDALNRGWINKEGDPMNNSVNRVTQSAGADAYAKDRFLKIREESERRMANTSGITPAARAKRQGVYSKRRTGNNLSTLLALPAAIGINAGIGLNNPMGGDDGRAAIFKSEDDPTKTDNVVAEIAAKYILGRQGELLPWNEYKKVRPDVSKDDYMAYKAYKWDKSMDLNPFDDGKFAPLPLGLLKFNSDGVDGAEIQFLGKNMDANTTLLPTGLAMGAAAIGAGLGRYGSLNTLGMDERIARNNANIEDIKNPEGIGPRELSKSEQARVDKYEKSNQRATGRKKLLDKLPQPIKKFSQKGPVRTGLVGGTLGLIAGTLVGNELERRRRKAAELEHGMSY